MAKSVREMISPSLDESFSRDTILVTQAIPASDVIHLATNCGLRHVVQKDAIQFDKELSLAEKMLDEPAAFLKNPLSCVVGAPLVEKSHFLHRCKPGASKQVMMDLLAAYLAVHSRRPALVDEILIAADELFTNGAKHSNADFPAPETPGEIEFHAYWDEDRMFLFCVDSFGLLNIEKMLERIHTCFQKGVGQSIKNGDGGAGIGSFMVFSACSSLYLGVEKGKRTIVGCSIQTIPRLLDRNEVAKNIHAVVL